MSPVRVICWEAILTVMGVILGNPADATEPSQTVEKRPAIAIRGIYGGVPSQIFDRGQTLDDYGVNAIWIGSGSAGHTSWSTSLKSEVEGLEGLRRVQHDARVRAI